MYIYFAKLMRIIEVFNHCAHERVFFTIVFSLQIIIIVLYIFITLVIQYITLYFYITRRKSSYKTPQIPTIRSYSTEIPVIKYPLIDVWLPTIKQNLKQSY